MIVIFCPWLVSITRLPMWRANVVVLGMRDGSYAGSCGSVGATDGLPFAVRV